MMTNRPLKKQLVFNNRQETIYPFLQDVVTFIEKHAPEKAWQLTFNARVIVTELLTNSIKHAGEGDTLVELSFDPANFIIRKTDHGRPFHVDHPQWSWPLPDGISNPVCIYADALNGLYAQVVSPHSLSFYAESYPVADDDSFADISEHYGLIIICRASNTFVYEYDPAAGQNTFTVVMNMI